MNQVLITAKQIADMCSISYRTVYRLMARSDFPRPRKIGSNSRWVKEEIEAYLKTAFTEASNAAERQSFVRSADTLLVEFLLSHDTATVEDVVAELPVGVAATCKSLIGREPEKAGVIEKCGETKSTRKSAKMRTLTLWRIANRQAAEEFCRNQ